MTPQVQPLPYAHRSIFFYLLLTIFMASLPFLYLYATGYRFQFGDQTLVSTGGLYVAAERTGAEIYIDNELVRETRVFRRAFYAQGLEATTHRVHVQKEGHHTWVKELPVYPHLVTEALAFNLPVVPEVDIISPWQTPAGVDVLVEVPDILKTASATNQYLIEPRANIKTLIENENFSSLLEYFATTTELEVLAENPLRTSLFGQESATSTATTSKEWQGVRLYEDDGEVYATYVGRREQMPYYYCAEEFPPYDPTVATSTKQAASVALAQEVETPALDLEVQKIAEDIICDPTVLMERDGEDVIYFDFFPNSSDLIVLSQESGVYVVEIDDRAWQNRQALLLGEGLVTRVIGGNVYIYDGNYIYRIQVEDTWF